MLKLWILAHSFSIYNAFRPLGLSSTSFCCCYPFILHRKRNLQQGERVLQKEENKQALPQTRFFKNWKMFTDIFVDPIEEMRILNTVDIMSLQDLLNKDKEKVMRNNDESITCTPLYKPSLNFLKMY